MDRIWISQCDQHPMVRRYTTHPNEYYWVNDDRQATINKLKYDDGSWSGKITSNHFEVCPYCVKKTCGYDFIYECTKTKKGHYVSIPEGHAEKVCGSRKRKAVDKLNVTSNKRQSYDALESETHVLPKIKYPQGDSFTCVTSSLASALHHIGAKSKTGEDLAEIVDSLKDQQSGKIMTLVLSTLRKSTGWEVSWEKNCKDYKPWEVREEWPTLVCFEDSTGFSRHCICVLRDMIFDSNKEQALPLSKENLDKCSIHDGGTFVKPIKVLHMFPGKKVVALMSET